MSIQSIHSALDQIVSTAKAVASAASLVGVPGAALAQRILSAGQEIGDNALKNIESGALVVSSGDVEQIRTKLTEIQAANDELAGQVDLS